MGSKYEVSIEALEKSAHVPLEDLIEELDVSQVAPDAKSAEDRQRELIMRIGGGA